MLLLLLFLVESSNLHQLSRLFDSFALLLEKYPQLIKESHFVFVSGCQSIHPSRFLPYPKVVFVVGLSMCRFPWYSQSNSDSCLAIRAICRLWAILAGVCLSRFFTHRIRYYTQEICIYREEMLEELAKNTIHSQVSDPSVAVWIFIEFYWLFSRLFSWLFWKIFEILWYSSHSLHRSSKHYSDKAIWLPSFPPSSLIRKLSLPSFDFSLCPLSYVIDIVFRIHF